MNQLIEEMAPPTHYEALQVAPDCSQEDIKRAYHASVLMYHPDKQHPGETNSIAFQKVQEAYQALRTAELRRLYDQKLEEARLRSEHRISDEIAIDDMTHDKEEEIYMHGCRCGEYYVLTEEEREEQVDVVPCDGCSLYIRVIYN